MLAKKGGDKIIQLLSKKNKNTITSSMASPIVGFHMTSPKFKLKNY